MSIGLEQVTKEIEQFLQQGPKSAANVALTLLAKNPSLTHHPLDASNVQLPMFLAGLIIRANEKHIYSGAKVAIVVRR